MSIADSDSGVRGLSQASVPVGSGARHSHSGMWLNGEVLSCSCPECSAPMSVRLWLRLADCWQCGTSIELTEEQHRAALRLLHARRDAAGAGNRQIPAWSEPVAPRSAPEPTARAPAAPASIEPPAEARQPAPAPPDSPPRQARPIAVPPRIAGVGYLGAARDWLKDWFAEPIAWLVSLLLHMVLIILLGMCSIDHQESDPHLVLALRFAAIDQPGESDVLLEAEPMPEFDLPDERSDEPLEPNQVLPSAPLLLPEVALLDSLPDMVRGGELPPMDVSGAPEIGKLLAGRSAGMRQQLVERDGGTIESEAAVARALRWLARHQNPDGSWSLHAFHHTEECNGQCSHPGVRSDNAGTGLALLPFLGAGQTHLHGQYVDTVARGLGYLVRVQQSDGNLMGPGDNGRMYAHGIAAIALCEAYALTRHEVLRDPAQRSLDFIVAAQHSAGGWRYRPGQAGDTSVVGWQLMALRSGQMASLNVPTSCFAKAQKFMDSVQPSRAIGQFSYMPKGGVTRTMTAEGLLCRQYGGWRQTHPPLVKGIDWLLEKYPPNERNYELYYLYYATQVIHHQGGEAWAKWNPQVRDLLVSKQERSGHEAGSWSPERGHDSNGGRLYMTALAACTLEVYYRHLPLYRKQP